jgi:hypothetical protein
MTGMSRAQLAGTAVTVAVAAAVIAGIYVLGSPLEERARRLDDRRVEDLSGISQALDVYWTRQSSLPASLDRLRPETGANVTTVDPATGAPYEYRALEGGKYELCASFEGESRETARRVNAVFWTHRAGRQCFEREAQSVR